MIWPAGFALLAGHEEAPKREVRFLLFSDVFAAVIRIVAKCEGIFSSTMNGYSG
jgi:hypothetical protein